MRNITVWAVSWFVVMAWCLTEAPPAAAAPLDPARVPADAKWVIHVDFEAMSGSELMESFRDKRPKLAKRIRHWMQERYGIDPRSDLKGLTLFSNSYKSHTGAAILHADYDREKVESDVLSKAKVKTSKWQDYTLYAWEVGKRGSGGHHHADGGGKTVTAVLLDGGTVVFAPSEEQAKSVVEFLGGEGASLEGAESRLVKGVPEGTFIYGAAIDLESISRHGRAFPVLQQLQYAMWAAGERNGEVFKEVKLQAHDEETARQMEKVLEGFVALGKVWSAGMKHMAELYDHVHVMQEGTTVHVEWHGGADETIEGLDEFGARVKRWRQAKRARE